MESYRLFLFPMDEVLSLHLGHVEFPEGRIGGAEALQLLQQATGLAPAFLLREIPELRREDLSFGLAWPPRYSNAYAGREFFVLYVLALNVHGDQRGTVEGINRSYHVCVTTSEVSGFSELLEANENLAQKHATARTPH